METRDLPNGDTIRINDLVDGSYWSKAGEFDVRGEVIGWSPNGIVIAYRTGPVTCHPGQVRLAVETAR